MRKSHDKLFSDVPTYKELMSPVLEALQSLGGSGTISELDEKVISSLNFTEDAATKIYEPNNAGRPIINYNLAWARSYLKKYGLIDNSTRGVWALTPAFKEGYSIDVEEIVRKVKESGAESSHASTTSDDETIGRVLQEQCVEDWKEQLHQTLMNMSPDAFERLAMRLLRESGFVEVEVTGRSGDGGIDGKGIAKLQGILSFPVIFQCKRYKNSVSPAEIRDFRGAMVGRVEKGLFITTGSFSRAAVEEAKRTTPHIDLVDGEDLALMLKQLRLGINVRMVEEVTVNEAWFKEI